MNDQPDQPISPNPYHEPPKPGQRVVYINASLLKSAGNCDRKLNWQGVEGWTCENKVSNFKAGYGTALHKGLECWYAKPAGERSISLIQELATSKVTKTYEPYCPYIDEKDWRTASHLVRTWHKYCAFYCPLNDPLTALQLPLSNVASKSLLEQKFCIPYYEDNTLVVYITGTIDMPAEYCGQLCIADHKSTSRKPEEFFMGFKFNIQAQFYVHWFKILSGMDTYVPFLVNGIFIKKNLVEDEKKGLFNGVSFERRLVVYSDEQMKEYSEWLNWKLNAIIDMIEGKLRSTVMMNPSACEGKWSMCQYYNVCAKPAQFHNDILRSSFQQIPYNPLKQIEIEE